MTRFSLNRWKGLRPLPKVLLAGILSLPLAACDLDEILQVDDPDFASPESLEGEDGVPVLIAGALAEFQVAVSGSSSGNEGYITVDGLITDQLRSSDTFTDRDAMDQRRLEPVELGNRSDFAYVNLHRARQAAVVASRAIESVFGLSSPQHAANYARMKMLEGYTYVYLGEGFCSNLPFTTLDDAGAIVPGASLSTTQTFEAAIAIFDEAIAAAPGSEYANAARIGKARAQLNLNNASAAAATAAAVPTDFAYFIEHSDNSGRQYNGNFALQDNGRYTVPNNEGGNGLPYVDELDAEFARTGFDGTTPVYIARYFSFGADVPVAEGAEARFIQAEAALAAGNLPGFVSNLNAATGKSYTVADLPATAAGRVDLLFDERAYTLFLTGHRLGDLRRLIRQYGRTEDGVYPTGTFFQGGEYGNDIVFSVPFEEINNPLYDPTQCSTTTA